jgi:hypothetical protein
MTFYAVAFYKMTLDQKRQRVASLAAPRLKPCGKQSASLSRQMMVRSMANGDAITRD